MEGEVNLSKSSTLRVYWSAVSVAILIFLALLVLTSTGCSRGEKPSHKMEGSWALVESVWSGEQRPVGERTMKIKEGRVFYDGDSVGEIVVSGGQYRLRTLKDGQEYLGRFILIGDYLVTNGNPKSIKDGGAAPNSMESNRSNGYRASVWMRVQAEEEEDAGSPAGLAS